MSVLSDKLKRIERLIREPGLTRSYVGTAPVGEAKADLFNALPELLKLVGIAEELARTGLFPALDRAIDELNTAIPERE
jgi:hypothetical protein